MTLDRAAVAAAVRALDLGDLAARRWYAGKGRTPSSAALAHAFPLAVDVVLALVDLHLAERAGMAAPAGGDPGRDRSDAAGAVAGPERYAIAFIRDPADGTVREATEGAGAWRALASAMAEGRVIPALACDGDGGAEAPGDADAVLVCRPASGLAAAWAAPDATGDPDLAADLFVHAPGGLALASSAPHSVDVDPASLAGAIGRAMERPLGRDQSNTSVVIGERLLLKAYRRVQAGLNPDLELTAFLSEEAGFGGVPPLAGYAEAVTRDAGVSTVAMLQVFVAEADDLYERTAELLTDLVAAPGSVSMEWATEVAAGLGALVAALHAALATPPEEATDLVPRSATRDEIAAWHRDARRQLDTAIDAVAIADPAIAAELRGNAAAIGARFARFDALATPPLVMRIHADLHLGQLLVDGDRYRVIDFEGEPLRPIADRRRLDSPLRDVASLLRSLDHVARSAVRRAERRQGGPIERPGIDIEAWIERSRERFLAAYAAGLRWHGAPFGLDLELLDAFEVAKETYEFAYAATVLPSWLWAPREGMRWLLARGETG